MAKKHLPIVLRTEFHVNEDGLIDLGFGDLISVEAFAESFDDVVFDRDHSGLAVNDSLLEYFQNEDKEVLLVIKLGEQILNVIGKVSKVDQEIPGVISKDHKSIRFTRVPSSIG